MAPIPTIHLCGRCSLEGLRRPIISSEGKTGFDTNERVTYGSFSRITEQVLPWLQKATILKQ